MDSRHSCTSILSECSFNKHDVKLDSGKVGQSTLSSDADGGMTTTFSSNYEVLAYIGDKILTPTWVDPVCGEGNCEYPWEFPAWGRFGCK